MGETSNAASGFGHYSRETLKRLHATGKYELAELASYTTINDKRNSELPWRVYANEVEKDDPRYPDFASNQINSWGKWRFERVCLDFEPDIVWTIRDPWMDAWIDFSPLRNFFHWVWMPTVDSVPQQEEWLDTFLRCDGLLTYCDWAKDELAKQTNNKLIAYDSAPPSVTIETYTRVEDKIKHKQTMGINPDYLIIGTIMRNQVRKLFPDLFKSFRMFLDKCETSNKLLGNRSFLYCHTSYPDLNPWDIPGLLKEHQLGNKVLFSYMCRNKNCGIPFFGFFQDAKTHCPACHHQSGFFPATGLGYTPEQMAAVYNMFDVYVQYSICEGAGMPQEEAAVCGVPVMSVDYSAMSDIVRKTDGFPIRVQRMFKDITLEAERAYPDNQHLVDTLFSYLNKPQSVRALKSKRVAQISREYYNWDRTSKIWERYFDQVELKGLQGNWSAPSNKLNPNIPVPEGLSDSDFVQFLFKSILRNEGFAHSLLSQGLVRDLNYNYSITGKTLGIGEINRETLTNVIRNMAKIHNSYDDARLNRTNLPMEDYLEYAKLKDE